MNNNRTVTDFALRAVDLISQAVISLAGFVMKRHNESYPVGRSRLEALGVIGCACIMWCVKYLPSLLAQLTESASSPYDFTCNRSVQLGECGGR